MGFFDDLDAEVSLPQGDALAGPVLLGDYGPVVEELRKGWVHTVMRIKPDQEKSKPRQFQEVELAWDAERGRFTWTHRLAETAGRKRGRTLSEEVRFLDEQGLADALHDSPWIGHAALDALGIDRSRPEF